MLCRNNDANRAWVDWRVCEGSGATKWPNNKGCLTNTLRLAYYVTLYLVPVFEFVQS